MSDLRQHQCLTLLATTHWTFERDRRTVRQAIGGRFTADSVEALHQACLEGLGIARLSRWNVREDLAGGRLVDVPLSDFNRARSRSLGGSAYPTIRAGQGQALPRSVLGSPCSTDVTRCYLNLRIISSGRMMQVAAAMSLRDRREKRKRQRDVAFTSARNTAWRQESEYSKHTGRSGRLLAECLNHAAALCHSTNSIGYTSVAGSSYGCASLIALSTPLIFIITNRLNAIFGNLLELAHSANSRVRALFRSKTADAFRCKRAMLLVAYLTGTGIAHCFTQLVGMIFGNVNYYFVFFI